METVHHFFKDLPLEIFTIIIDFCPQESLPLIGRIDTWTCERIVEYYRHNKGYLVHRPIVTFNTYEECLHIDFHAIMSLPAEVHSAWFAQYKDTDAISFGRVFIEFLDEYGIHELAEQGRAQGIDDSMQSRIIRYIGKIDYHFINNEAEIAAAIRYNHYDKFEYLYNDISRTDRYYYNFTWCIKSANNNHWRIFSILIKDFPNSMTAPCEWEAIAQVIVGSLGEDVHKFNVVLPAFSTDNISLIDDIIGKSRYPELYKRYFADTYNRLLSK